MKKFEIPGRKAIGFPRGKPGATTSCTRGKQNSKFKIIIFAIVAFLAAGHLPLNAFSSDNFFDNTDEWSSGDAGNVQITNKINVSANTGGNTAASGKIIEGKEKTNVEIKTIINGKEIDPVEIKSEASEVKVESKIEADGEKAQARREIEIGSEKKSENYQVDLKNSEIEAKDSIEAGAEDGKGDASREIKIDSEEQAENSIAREPGKEKAFNNLQNLWLNFIENLKFVFQNIFSIFR